MSPAGAGAALLPELIDSSTDAALHAFELLTHASLQLQLLHPTHSKKRLMVLGVRFTDVDVVSLQLSGIATLTLVFSHRRLVCGTGLKPPFKSQHVSQLLDSFTFDLRTHRVTFLVSAEHQHLILSPKPKANFLALCTVTDTSLSVVASSVSATMLRPVRRCSLPPAP